MPKRKRDDGTEEAREKSPEVVNDPKQKRLQLKLHQATVKLGHAFKVAKGFERQKLGRRQKTAAAAKNEKDAKRVEMEIAALKALDTTVAAQHHLYKCLGKIKAVASSPRLVPELAKLAPVQRDAATLNILSRLASSKPAKEALNTAIEDVQSAAGVVRKAPKKDSSQPEKEKKSAAPPVMDPMEITDEEDAGEHHDDDGDSEDEFGGFDDRLGSDESDDDDNDNDDDEQDSMDDRPPPTKQKASSFIPSLSVGYIAGSDSEPETDIEELAPVKKNRRGQRARQQLAEKKFGAKAKHLLNPKNDRSQGWDAKRGATDGARGGRGGRGGLGAGRGGFGAGAGRGGSFGKNGQAPGRSDAPAPPKKKHNDDEGPLHPSWAAAKAAKEKKATPVVFAGKKISFD